VVATDTWLDSVASIKDITSQDALFTFKDGTARRLPVISGNRFLYFANGKIEMGKLKRSSFLPVKATPLVSPQKFGLRAAAKNLIKDPLWNARL
jgi:hypothetical protein